jgi:hypothetical protein
MTLRSGKPPRISEQQNWWAAPHRWRACGRLRSEADVSVRVLTGGGGSGKTRLAVELLEWLEEAQAGQWNCGFLTLAEMQRFSGLQNLSQWRRRKPLLAVLDYAAGSAEWLRVWLEQLAAADSGGEKLRLLLLERAASLDSGWLAAALSRGYSASAVRALLDRPSPSAWKRSRRRPTGKVCC